MDGTSYIYDTELEMAYHRKGRYEINLYHYIDVDGWHYVKRCTPYLSPTICFFVRDRHRFLYPPK